MKFASFRLGNVETFGCLLDGRLYDLGGRLGAEVTNLRDAIAQDVLRSEAVVRGAITGDGYAPDKVEFLPLIPNPAKIICIGMNYREHVGETNGKETPVPGFFLRASESLIGHRQNMVRPRVSTQLDFEGELAVVIGRPGRHIPAAAALGHVAGYACFVDGSVRDFQKQSTGAGKNFLASGPLGPWLTPASAVRDPSRLTLTTRLNGERVQHAGLDLMIHSIPTIIAYVSQILPLGPGDIIATGSPGGSGIGRTPNLWLKAGDTLEVEISEVGLLSTGVVDE
jgi:2-keto-4-pentenoate hydratase/2-oxohepta-3-ene-1,7-dioic acid hydratase in catechol pathway